VLPVEDARQTENMVGLSEEENRTAAYIVGGTGADTSRRRTPIARGATRTDARNCDLNYCVYRVDNREDQCHVPSRTEGPLWLRSAPSSRARSMGRAHSCSSDACGACRNARYLHFRSFRSVDGPPGRTPLHLERDRGLRCVNVSQGDHRVTCPPVHQGEFYTVEKARLYSVPDAHRCVGVGRSFRPLVKVDNCRLTIATG